MFALSESAKSPHLESRLCNLQLSIHWFVCVIFYHNNDSILSFVFFSSLKPCVKAIGKMFHPEHFICAHCDKQIANESFHLDSGKPYCAQDYKELFCVKCCSCKMVIGGGDRWLEALDKPWHADCFRCAVMTAFCFVFKVSVKWKICRFQQKTMAGTFTKNFNYTPSHTPSWTVWRIYTLIKKTISTF